MEKHKSLLMFGTLLLILLSVLLYAFCTGQCDFIDPDITLAIIFGVGISSILSIAGAIIAACKKC